MSSLYRARVDQVAPAKVRLTVWQIHPDAGVPPKSTTFALALLCAPFRKSSVLQGSAPSARLPLAKAIDIEGGKDGDPSWMVENARAFIASVERKSLKNARPKASVKWPPPHDGDLSQLPQAVFEIGATDPAWVSHLKPGLSWRTAAYDMGKAKPASALHPRGKAAAASEQGASSKRQASFLRKTSQAKRKSSLGPTAASARRLELIRGTSKKFWEVELQGKSVVTRYGRLGAAARETKNSFAGTAEAKRAFDKLFAEKLTKGYRQV